MNFIRQTIQSFIKLGLLLALVGGVVQRMQKHYWYTKVAVERFLRMVMMGLITILPEGGEVY